MGIDCTVHKMCTTEATTQIKDYQCETATKNKKQNIEKDEMKQNTQTHTDTHKLSSHFFENKLILWRETEQKML